VFVSIVRTSMVPVVAFVAARSVALVGGGGGLPLLLPPPPPPPQPQATAQSIAQKSPRTFDRARWALGLRPSSADSTHPTLEQSLIIISDTQDALIRD